MTGTPLAACEGLNDWAPMLKARLIMGWPEPTGNVSAFLAGWLVAYEQVTHVSGVG